MSAPTLSLDDILAAHARIREHIHKTPVLTSATLDGLAGAKLFFKCENFQKTGAFKARGATNAVFKLTEAQLKKGVVTHSSGNHAAAVARAASLRGVRAKIVIPHSAPKAKIENVRRYHGEVILCEPTMASREGTVAKIVEETGAIMIHPFNNLDVMAGQGTAAVELLAQVNDLDLLVTPTSGAGLLSGTAIAAKGLRPGIEIVGAEPKGADDAYRSFQSGKIEPMDNPRTIADGLRSTLGSLTFPIVRKEVSAITTVSEAGIVQAMRTLWEVMKIVIEPSGAVPYGVIQEGALPVKGRRVGIILTGGNLDLDALPWMNAAAR